MHNAILKKNWWSHLVLSCGSSYTGTQSVDGVGMEREQGMVPEEGAGL